MNKNAGFTLIEVLIAMLVLAVGLLGLAGLQATSLKNNQSSYNRSQATQLAYDLADKMRANVPGVGTYTSGTATATANCLTTTGCSPANMAANDLSEWNSAVSGALPSGTGKVCLDSTPNDGVPATPACDGIGTTYAIKVWWDDDRSGTASLRFITNFHL